MQLLRVAIHRAFLLRIVCKPLQARNSGRGRAAISSLYHGPPRERDREKQTYRGRQTGGQGQRETKREGETDRETGTERDKERARDTERDRETD